MGTKYRVKYLYQVYFRNLIPNGIVEFEKDSYTYRALEKAELLNAWCEVVKDNTKTYFVSDLRRFISEIGVENLINEIKEVQCSSS